MENNVKKFQQPGRTKLIKGSILTPETAGLRLILSLANMAGKPSCPLIPIFDKKWRKVKEEVRGWFTNKTGSYKVGALHTTCVQSDTWVLSMLCQDDAEVVDLQGLEKCLNEVRKTAKYEQATIHLSTVLLDAIPELKDMVKTQLIDEGVSVYFYEEK